MPFCRRWQSDGSGWGAKARVDRLGMNSSGCGCWLAMPRRYGGSTLTRLGRERASYEMNVERDRDRDRADKEMQSTTV